MAFGSNETSVEGGRPIELFEFTIGAVTYRYTSAEDDVTYSAETYLAEPIMRTSPTLSSSENGRQQMEIQLPADNVIAARYIGIVPADRVDVRVLRFHRGDSPNGIVLWDGRIVSAKFEKGGGLCRLYSISSEAALARPCPGRKYQSMCNHTLYDVRCSVTKSSHKHTGAVLSISGAGRVPDRPDGLDRGRLRRLQPRAGHLHVQVLERHQLRRLPLRAVEKHLQHGAVICSGLH
jgi:hypothetical protein